MLLSLVEVAVGLVLVYFLVSTLCSGLIELVAHKVGSRGRFLRLGLLSLLPDRWIYLRVVNHPLLASLYRDVPGRIKHPSYIPGETFAQALFDVVVRKAAQINDAAPPADNRALTAADVLAAARVCRANGFTIGESLLPLVEQAGESLDVARRNVAAWYEAAMDRVSGWYKRRARWWLFWVGAGVAIVFNVDTIEITRALVQNPSLRTAMADEGGRVARSGDAGAGASVAATTGQLQDIGRKGLPIGFSCVTPDWAAGADPGSLRATLEKCWAETKARSGTAWALKAIGWLITALAVSLGGPFWFELLNRLVDIRGAGKKPPSVTTAAAAQPKAPPAAI
jgi:hypothetical protein